MPEKSLFRWEDLGDLRMVRFQSSQLGESDADTVFHEIARFLEGAGACKLVLDLSRLQFITSTVLGKLLQLKAKAREANAQLILFGLSEEARVALEVTGLAAEFTIYLTEAEVVIAHATICFNGINGVTGEYLTMPLAISSAIDMVKQSRTDDQQTIRFGHLQSQSSGQFLGLPMEIDPTDVVKAGWAIVFTPTASDAVRKALDPLVEYRRRQIPPDRFKILDLRPGETFLSWLAADRHRASGIHVDPTRIPYYLLLVGGPNEIPFEFQYLLDVGYAVGRVAFDRPEEYESYARGVVEYETGSVAPRRREVVFWAPRHQRDPATAMSCDCMMEPLAQGLPEINGQSILPAIALQHGFASRYFKAAAATKVQLLNVLHGRDGPPPAILVTASHGMGGWPCGDPRQRTTQGALLGQEWPGRGHIQSEPYLSAANVDGATVQGLVALLFACFSAGTPPYDSFFGYAGREPVHPPEAPIQLANPPFVAALPQRLLAAGALAVVGHVDRAWGFSLPVEPGGPQLQPFRHFLGKVMAKEPVGHAMADFGQRLAASSTVLASLTDPNMSGATANTDKTLVWTWIERNDAKSYVLLGDPAIRLRPDRLI